MLEIYTDGSTQPNNPGPSGYGVAVYRNGKLLTSFGKYLGNPFTNNQAEYCGLMAGLEAAGIHRKSGEPLILYTDSLLCVKHVSGKFQMNSRLLRPLYTVVMEQIEQELVRGSVEVKHVKGHSGIVGNEVADQEAGYASKNKRAMAPEWLLKHLGLSVEALDAPQGFEALSKAVKKSFRKQGVEVLTFPRVLTKKDRLILRKAGDGGSLTLLYSPEMMCVLPRIGTVLVALVTRFMPRPGLSSVKVLPTEGWKALKRWQSLGLDILIVYQAWGEGQFHTYEDLNLPKEKGIKRSRVVAPQCCFLAELTGTPVTSGLPSGWSPATYLNGPFVPVDGFVKGIEGYYFG